MFLRFHDQPSEVARCLDRRQATLAAALRFHGLFPAFVFVDEPCDPVIHVDPFEHPRECPPDCVMERAARVHRSRLQRGVTSVIEAAVISDDPVDDGFPKVDFFDSGHEVIWKRQNKSSHLTGDNAALGFQASFSPVGGLWTFSGESAERSPS